MLTINEIKALANLDQNTINYVLNVYGQTSLDDMEKMKDSIEEKYFTCYLYLWRNLTPRISGLYDDYRLYDISNE